jgi:hypothetical protein
VRTSPRPPKGRLPAKVRATQAKEAQAAAAAAAAAMEAVTASKSPNKRMILRRWMLRIRRYVRTFVFKIACTFM